jgi:hypothetical protein
MRRSTMLVAVIAIVVVVLAGAYVAMTVMANNQKTEYLVAQVYVSSWNSNISKMTPMDVQFKISLDLNNDGVYEVQQSSEVWNDTYLQQAPYRLGGPVASNLGHFNFKVEAFKVVNGIQTPLNYTSDGTIPVNQGSSAEGSSKSWSFDQTLVSNDDLACSIDYMYYVS